MAERDLKRAAKRRKRREKEARRETRPGGEDEGRAGGLLTGLRGGMQRVAGSGGETKAPEKGPKKLLDVVLWIAVIAALAFYLIRRYR